MLCVRLQNHAQQKKPLTAAVLQAAIDNIRGAVMICYPQGLPEWDFVRQCLEEREDLSGTNVGMLPCNVASLCTVLRCDTCHASTPGSCTSSSALSRPAHGVNGLGFCWVPAAPRQLVLNMPLTPC